MQIRIAPLPMCLFPGLVLAVAVMISTSAARAQAPTAKQQVIYLPDPTPRPPDPHLLLGDNPQAGTSTQEAVEHRNAKRRELVVWAANELVTLSERVQANVAKPKTSESVASAAADADKIEQLAKNLTAALKAQ
jgi:hypothetical protein